MDYPPSALASAVAPTARKPGQLTAPQKAVVCAMIALVGLDDSAMGSNLTAMQSFYGVSFDKISLVFLANTAGYFLAASTSSFISHHMGLQWLLAIAAVSTISGSLGLALAPPFPVFIFTLVLAGYGNGVYDVGLTAVISHADDGSLMSLIYAMFGVGALTSPLVVGALIDRGIAWNYFFYMPMAVSALLFLPGVYFFRSYESPADESASEREHPSSASSHRRPGVVQRMQRALRLRAVWAGFLLIIVSFSTANILSGWIIAFMTRNRHADEAASRFMLAGLWAGIALGRITLAYFLGRRMRDRHFAQLVLAFVCGCLSNIWAVSNVPTDAVFMAFCGFFLGPVTPKTLSAISSRLPPSLKSTVMALTIGLGMIGSALGPLFFGFAVDKGYLSSLPGVLIVLSIVGAAGWLIMPSQNTRSSA
ncbi:hypothetical protein JCM8097_008677 [Rhodosporidiobolus ruineniae]